MKLLRILRFLQIGSRYAVRVLAGFCLCGLLPAAIAQSSTPQPYGTPDPQAPRKVSITSGVAVGMLLEKTVPVYPPIAKAARVSGTVVLQATISKTGTIEDLHVVSGTPLLQQAAMDAVKTWRYKPYLLEGHPVTVETTINVVFTLGDEAPAWAPGNGEWSLARAPLLPDSVAAKDPAEFNACQSAVSQSDPKARAAALESFLQAYPHSPARKAVLDMMLDTYYYPPLKDVDKAISAAGRLLEEDPNNMKAIFLSEVIQYMRCLPVSDMQSNDLGACDVLTCYPKTSDTQVRDVQVCEEAAALGLRGLALPMPDNISADDWNNQSRSKYAIFHSAIASDDTTSKRDFKSAIPEYRAALRLYPADGMFGVPLGVTLKLAEAYTRPETRDITQTIWFFSRAWGFVPEGPARKKIETVLESYYKDYHGSREGLDAVKAQAAVSVFPPEHFTIQSASAGIPQP